jgi:hypothetical protein
MSSYFVTGRGLRVSDGQRVTESSSRTRASARQKKPSHHNNHLVRPFFKRMTGALPLHEDRGKECNQNKLQNPQPKQGQHKETHPLNHQRQQLLAKSILIQGSRWTGKKKPTSDQPPVDKNSPCWQRHAGYAPSIQTTNRRT